MMQRLLGPYQSLRTAVVEPRNVLLVELTPARAEALAARIEARGHRALIAHDLREALGQLLTATPDLIVLGAREEAPGPLVDAVEHNYARGVRPQVITDHAEDLEASGDRVLRLLDAA